MTWGPYERSASRRPQCKSSARKGSAVGPGIWKTENLKTNQRASAGLQVGLSDGRAGHICGSREKAGPVSRTVQRNIFRAAEQAPTKEMPSEGPNERLPPARGQRWGLWEEMNRRERPRRARISMTRLARFFITGPACSLVRAPAPAPCGECTLFWGPRYRLPCVCGYSPHPDAAQARRVYKQVGHKTAKLRTAAAAQKFRAKSNFARAGFHHRARSRGPP